MYIYFETNSTDPCFNLAMEEHLLLHHREGDILMFWRNDDTVVVGCNQNTEAEINRRYVEEHGVTVVRRTTGGGAVYHDLGNLNYSLITDFSNDGEESLARFLEPMAAALRALGLPAEVSGRNDITVAGKKVSGNAQRIHEGRILHHGTLLFECDPEKVAGALQVDETKLRAKGIHSVHSRVGDIHSFLPPETGMEDFKRALKKQLLGDADVRPEALTEPELESIRTTAEQKYRSWEWTYGRSRQFGTVRGRRFPDGLLEISCEVDHGRICAISFAGDFLSVSDCGRVAETLRGCRFQRESVREILRGFRLSDYFGKIREEDILDLLFYDV